MKNHLQRRRGQAHPLKRAHAFYHGIFGLERLRGAEVLIERRRKNPGACGAPSSKTPSLAGSTSLSIWEGKEREGES